MRQEVNGLGQTFLLKNKNTPARNFCLLFCRIKGWISGCIFFAKCGEVENHKSEARNSKQYPMTQIQMTKTLGRWVSVLNIEEFVF
jgi:hypothetical protein